MTSIQGLEVHENDIKQNEQYLSDLLGFSCSTALAIRAGRHSRRPRRMG